MPTFPIELIESQVIVAIGGKPRIVSIGSDETIGEVYPDAIYVTAYPVWSSLEALMTQVTVAVKRFAEYQSDF